MKCLALSPAAYWNFFIHLTFLRSQLLFGYLWEHEDDLFSQIKLQIIYFCLLSFFSLLLFCCFYNAEFCKIIPLQNDLKLNIFLQARTIEYDVNFLNFNSDAIRRLSGPDYEQHWKSSYGFDFVSKPELKSVKVGDNYTTLETDASEIAKHCIQSEYR